MFDLNPIKSFALQNNVDLDISFAFDGSIKISRIFVPKTLRKQGIGTKVMSFICQFADKENRIILLSPSTDFGATSVDRLKRFYRQFGFKNNIGGRKNFKYSETMIRYPNS